MSGAPARIRSRAPAEPGLARRETKPEAPVARAQARGGAHGGNPVSPVLLAPSHRRHHSERLRSRGDLVRKGIVGGIERDVLSASKEADEIPALRRPVIANRPAQGGKARLQRVEDRALRRPLLGVDGDLTIDACKGPQVVRKHDADHGSVCASTDRTAGRSWTIAVQLSPPSGDA